MLSTNTTLRWFIFNFVRIITNFTFERELSRGCWKQAERFQANDGHLGFRFFLGRARKTRPVINSVDGDLETIESFSAGENAQKPGHTLNRKCLRWSGPISAICSKTGGSQRFFVQYSCKMEMGCLPWQSLINLATFLVASSSFDTRPFLSVLMSSSKGSRVPSLLRPKPSPGCQPIFCISLLPMLSATGAAFTNWSFVAQAYRSSNCIEFLLRDFLPFTWGAPDQSIKSGKGSPVNGLVR